MRLRATHWVVPLYALGALLFTWPLAREAGRAVPTTGLLNDARLQAFLLGWDWQALRASPWALFHPPIFHPERNVLTYMDHLVGETLAAAPVLAATGSVAAGYNCLVWLSFVASGWAVYRLARLLALPRGAAFLGGFLFAFSPYRFANLDQLNLLQTQFLPVAILFALRFQRRRRARDLGGLVACGVAQVYFGWYYTFFLGIALAVGLAYAAARRAAPWRPATLAAAAAVAAAAALAVAPVVRPYLEQARAMPEYRRTLLEVETYSANPLDYLRVNRGALVSGWLPAAPPDQAYWPGVVTVGLGALGAAAVLRRRRPRGDEGGYFVALGVTAFVLSLGPYLHGAGQRIGPALPYAALYHWVPGFASVRTPARLAVLVVLAAAVLAAVGYAAARARGAGRPGWRWAAGAIFLVAVVGAAQRPLATLRIPGPAELPAAYAWIARQPDAGPILDVPVAASPGNESARDLLRQYYVLLHGLPRLDGASGFVSPRYRRFRAALWRFPEPAALGAAAELGARWVVVHLGDYPPAERARLRAALGATPELTPAASFGGDAVYRLRGGAAP